jgi:hypothetical protein
LSSPGLNLFLLVELVTRCVNDSVLLNLTSCEDSADAAIPSLPFCCILPFPDTHPYPCPTVRVRTKISFLIGGIKPRVVSVWWNSQASNRFWLVELSSRELFLIRGTLRARVVSDWWNPQATSCFWLVELSSHELFLKTEHFR